MKTITICMVFLLLLSVGFVSAQQAVGNGQASPDSEDTNDSLDSVDESGMLISGQAKKIKSGENFTNPAGQTVQVRGEENRIRLRANGAEAGTDDLEITSEGQKLMTKLSNGRNAEIKVMPNTASETALARLRLKVCTEERNCTIELKEVGQGNETKLAYELQTQRKSRVFGIFPAMMRVRAQVDAENGEVLQVKKPWWAFLASEPEEEAEEVELEVAEEDSE